MINLEETMQILPSSQIDSLNYSIPNNKEPSSFNKLEMNITNNDKDKERLYYRSIIEYKRLGNTYVFFYKSSKEPLCLIGPHCNSSINNKYRDIFLYNFTNS